jgi:DNA helicase IV
MLATVALALDPQAAGAKVEHLIVDEAQDVRPLEWRILTTSILTPGGSLSLFGDMNQRRSDWTPGTWEQLAEDLELTDDDGACTIHELAKGYRCTRQILKFANQLLPRGERPEHALRDGPVPIIRKVPRDSRVQASVDSAMELTARHDGLVALISLDPDPASVEFRKRRWVRGRYQHSWARDGATVVVLHPDEARGLEFDAAVVVEPGEFPENVGRHGLLYTSLTRANKELVVIHSEPLPRSLRPPR